MTEPTQTKPTRPPYTYGKAAGLIIDAILIDRGTVTVRPGGRGIWVTVNMPTNVPDVGSISATGYVGSLADVGQVAEHCTRQALAHYWAEDPDQPIASAMQAFGLFTSDLADAAAIRDLLEIWHSQTTTKPGQAKVTPLAEAQPVWVDRDVPEDQAAQVAAWREGVTI